MFWRQHGKEDSCCAELQHLSLSSSSTVLLVAGRQVLVVAVNPTRTYILSRIAATSSTVCSTDSGRCCNASLSAMFPSSDSACGVLLLPDLPTSFEPHDSTRLLYIAAVPRDWCTHMHICQSLCHLHDMEPGIAPQPSMMVKALQVDGHTFHRCG